MSLIKLSVWVGEDKKLTIDLPAEIPVGPVDVVVIPYETIPPTYASKYPDDWVEKREQFRQKLLEAGRLSTAHTASPDTVPLSPGELLRIGTLPPGARPTDELIDEDRGPR
jgi:hypothetical protein